MLMKVIFISILAADSIMSVNSREMLRRVCALLSDRRADFPKGSEIIHLMEQPV